MSVQSLRCRRGSRPAATTVTATITATITAVITAAVWLTVLAAPAEARRAEVAEIRKLWRAYGAALTEKRGAAAADMVSRNTLAHYGRLQGLALTGPRAKIRALGPMDQLVIYQMRHMLTGPRLKAMTPRQVYGWSVTSGLSNADSIKSLKLRRVLVDDDEALAEVTYQGNLLKWRLRFEKTDGRWRYDPLPLIRRTNTQFGYLLRRRNLPVEAFIEMGLRRVTKKPVDMKALDKPLLE